MQEPKWFNPAYKELNRLVETLTNLLFLIQHDSGDPEKVEFYVSLGERCLERARVILREQLGSYSPN